MSSEALHILRQCQLGPISLWRSKDNQIQSNESWVKAQGKEGKGAKTACLGHRSDWLDKRPSNYFYFGFFNKRQANLLY